MVSKLFIEGFQKGSGVTNGIKKQLAKLPEGEVLVKAVKGDVVPVERIPAENFRSYALELDVPMFNRMSGEIKIPANSKFRALPPEKQIAIIMEENGAVTKEEAAEILKRML